jgi:hypothetical protein
MNSRFAMIGMLGVLVAAGVVVIYFGVRDPERHVTTPEMARPIERMKTGPPPQSQAPVNVERSAPKDETPWSVQEVPAVDGMVSDKAGAPIAGATLHLGEAANGPELARTGLDGHFALASAPARGATLTATHPNYLSRTVAFTPGKETPLRITIILDKGGGIAGTVLRGGRPAPNVKALEGESAKSTSTDAQGRFAFAGMPPGSFVVRVELGENASEDVSPSAPWLLQRVEVKEGEVATADFDIPDCDSALEGFVVFEGRPLAQTNVVLQIANTRGQYHAAMDTGANGGYRFSALPDGPADVWVSIPLANGSDRKKSAHLDLNIRETLRQDFDFPVAGTVQGQVVGLRDGEQASVLASRGAVQQSGKMSYDQLMKFHENVTGSVNVASDGSFAFEALDPGDYVLMVIVGQQASIDFRSATQAVNVVAGADVSVRIVMR